MSTIIIKYRFDVIRRQSGDLFAVLLVPTAHSKSYISVIAWLKEYAKKNPELQIVNIRHITTIISRFRVSTITSKVPLSCHVK